MENESELEDRLWNKNVIDEYDDKDKCKDHVLEQYKIYVEMADRISARRSSANTFFLTLNTLIVGALSACAEKFSRLSVIVICIAAIVLCYVWKRLINSYRQLNTAKYAVIGEFEKKLPSSPYWSAEWSALGEGKDPKKYKQLTSVEKWVPIVFICLYLLLCVVIVKDLSTASPKSTVLLERIESTHVDSQ
jgi:hypothetical protein